jgi:hypothetical protein
MNRRREGNLTIECLAAIMLAAIALTGVSQLLVFAGRQQYIHEQRRFAASAAANVTEKLMTRPFEQLTTENLDAFQLPPEARDLLPAATVAIRVTELEGTPAAKQVQVTVNWRNGSHQPEQFQLLSWRYDRGDR